MTVPPNGGAVLIIRATLGKYVAKSKVVSVWPFVIAKCEACYQIVCSTCGEFNVPLSYVLTIRRCLLCGRKDIDCQSLGHAHYWAMQVLGQRGEEAEGDRRLKEALGIDSCHKICLSNFRGPFDDEFSAVMQLSKELGLVRREVKA